MYVIGFVYFTVYFRSASDRQLQNIWDGCETYFMRTIARLAALEAALKQPAADLGIQNIERCRGFSAHLMVRYFLIPQKYM